MVATAYRVQCGATTKKGYRCKLYALPGGQVCHVHVKKNNNKHSTQGTKHSDMKMKPSNTFSKKKSIELDKKLVRGNIYVFTYAHMMHEVPTMRPYLHLAEPTANHWINYSKTEMFDASEKVLIKVGYTRKRPETRVKEWKEQCGHSEFTLVYPGYLFPTYSKTNPEENLIKSLSKMFKRLSFGRPRALSGTGFGHTGKNYAHLNPEKTCFISAEPYQSEQNIHKILKLKFGSGKLFCDGCARNKVNPNKNSVKSIGVHTEWFLIPRNSMHIVWEVIESQCV